jgi:hypothetical protein
MLRAGSHGVRRRDESQSYAKTSRTVREEQHASCLDRHGPWSCSSAGARGGGRHRAARSHMLMQDKNNAEIADVIQNWLAGKGMVE